MSAGVIAASPAFYGFGAIVLASPPIDWLPVASEARPLLGVLLGAQAAITALTLAVMLFVLQASARRDADDRMYHEYVRQSGALTIFRGSIAAVGLTALVLLAEEFGSRGAPVLGTWPGLPNLALIGAGAFGMNLVLSLLLFERALPLTAPGRWQMLRLAVYERDVRDGVQVFVQRHRRALAKLEADEPDFADAFPDPGEGPANEAISALLDYALGAMDQRQQADFGRALDSIKELIEYAMDEIESHGLTWEQPGSQPEWPPLRELGSNLYTFREEVISRGNREHAFGLLRLDYWLLSQGVRRRCGELFTVGLEGYRRNDEITRRVDRSDLRGMFRDRAWSVLPGALVNVAVEEAVPYVKHAVRQQERLLADAMSTQDASDFKSLMDGFSDMLNHLRFSWGATRWPRPASADRYDDLLRAYRVRLMGLGGRAMLLSEQGRIAAPEHYVEAVRDAYDDLERLAADVSQAVVYEGRESFSLWADWEMEGARSLETRRLRPEQYPLTFFSVRLLELARDPMPVLDLRGRAQQVLDWFEENIEGLKRHVELDPETSFEERRELAVRELRAAVERDKIAADEEMIRRELSQERVAAFTADVYAAAFSKNAMERLFARAGAFEYLASAADGGLKRRCWSHYESKGLLAEEPEDDRACRLHPGRAAAVVVVLHER
ncbi:MAG: hypothetical protein OXI50_14330, partial [Gammaproteobacteria bacterium]|nr:hypothetical protein [Gammaproteobacteria bacterium]